jgi:hypothetical protein
MELIALKAGQDWFVKFSMSHHIAGGAIETAVFVFFLIQLTDQCHLMPMVAEGS